MRVVRRGDRFRYIGSNSCGKIAYKSRAKANRAKKRSSGANKGTLYVYFCIRCGNWHLSSKKQ